MVQSASIRGPAALEPPMSGPRRLARSLLATPRRVRLARASGNLIWLCMWLGRGRVVDTGRRYSRGADRLPCGMKVRRVTAKMRQDSVAVPGTQSSIVWPGVP